ncbi:DUF6458 family protein [Nocardioides deserti]|uniref:DUF6458 domain-containing protein n=1 Tax=Nocardioides deserti TaxID=1588644 RepID=A0ABR6UDM0_9ACTN|nr:DUF6458 family protein [Nocardioides deserti]MBC2962556.1 hypothetical protein [Nocardioides deserti]GGO70016.1 hypothetical protein GCM10012276_07590 [Nocardioides deserti]
MGYGLGVFLLVVGLILALAVEDAISGVDLTMVGWIMTIGGILVLVLTAVTLNSRRARGGTVSSTTHTDGSQTVQRQDPPAV